MGNLRFAHGTRSPFIICNILLLHRKKRDDQFSGYAARVPRSFAVRRMAVKTQAIRAIDPSRIEDPGTPSIHRVRFVPNQE